MKFTNTIKPFNEIIKVIQEKRREEKSREYPKGHVMNLLYKEMGNSLYGNVLQGCRIKTKKDL
jgi:hypothetical protein